ncbi:MAG: signal peptidase II [Candidatus Omnitrophota bacterium]
MVLSVVFLVLLSDQLTKFFITRNLTLNESIPLIKGVLILTLVHNRGAAFGIFKGQFYLFIFISVATVIIIYFILRKSKEGVAFSLSLSMILGGALGNLIDRLTLGYVVDFLDFHFWPVFNIADSAITIGAIILGWLLFKPANKNVS